MKKSLIIGIILVIITIVLTAYNDLVNRPINIHDITNSGSKKENVNVYLNATFIAGSITGDNEKSYYVIFGDKVQYIVYIENNEANRINNYLLDNPEETYRIEGVTRLIPKTMEDNGKKFVKNWLDNNHSHSESEEEHDHNITTDDFYHYFGYVYLDVTANFDVIKIIIYLTGITGILFILYFFNTRYHFI